MEVVVRKPDRSFWKGRHVLLTGHTGFKGSWATLLLNRLGARVTGFSLPGKVSDPDLFHAAGLGSLCDDRRGDIRDPDAFASVLAEVQPDVLIHMAAQPIVLEALRNPVEAFEVNTLGVARVLDACRASRSLAAVCIVTSDKCYENREQIWPYREGDAMGGKDPYSASKGCAELVASSFARSYFTQSGPRVFCCRAGNVIGGGDWAADRLVPDLVRAALTPDAVTEIRSPEAVRPWQHVLDPVLGYLFAVEDVVARSSWSGFDAWNFGPNPGEERTVREIASVLQSLWDGNPKVRYPEGGTGSARNEARILRVDNTKAKIELGWRPVFPGDTAVAAVVDWHRAVASGTGPLVAMERQIAPLLTMT